MTWSLKPVAPTYVWNSSLFASSPAILVDHDDTSRTVLDRSTMKSLGFAPLLLLLRPWRKSSMDVDALLSPHQHATSPRTRSPLPPTKNFVSLRTATNTNEPTAAAGSSSAINDDTYMNRYNVLFETAVEKWTAVLRPPNDLQDAGIFLGCRTDKDYYVDTVKTSFQRNPGSGLGIVLLELQSRDADGVGIVVVEDVVEGGSAASSGLIPGDSIVQIDVSNDSNSSNNGDNKAATARVQTECLNYDRTIDAILSLPPCSDAADVQTVVVTAKRIRRRPKVRVTFQYPPSQRESDLTLELFAGENLRRSMLVRGIKLNDPLARRFDSGGTGDCGAEGTCATCSVSVTRGMELLNDMGMTESQILAKNPRWRMACRTVVGYGMQEGEITIRVNPKQWS
jgi:2Fe-2S iron-sulfur cluster binding domain